jgi:ATP-dependent Zn protease
MVERRDRSSTAEINALIESARYTGPTVTAEQLVGVESCLRQLAGQLALVARPHLAQRFGLEPSGTLFIGPPGTGKTLLARYLAGQLAMPMYQFAADEFQSNPELIHGVFRRLSDERALVFIDEISILAQRRDWGDAEDRRMLSALITSLDGLSDTATRPWVVGACTPDIQLDHAIHRSGRLGVVVEFAVPSADQRRQLFELYLRPVPHALAAGDIGRLAEMANGATGADVRDWVSQAASEVLAEAETDEPRIEYRHLETVVARRGFVAAEGRADRKPTYETALHEAGHAAVAWACFGRAALARLDIRFGSSNSDLEDSHLGHFEVSNDWLAVNKPNSRTWPEHAAVALAGVCTEEALLGHRGAGGEVDVSNATRIIIGQLDTGDPDFGPSRSQVETAAGIFREGSEAMRATVWHLVRPRFASCWLRTAGLVADHRQSIERLARALLADYRALSGDEIEAILEGRRRARRGLAGAPVPPAGPPVTR